MRKSIRMTRTLVGTLTLAAALSAPLWALPEGPSVSNGQVNITNPGAGQMTVQQLTDRAIVNWNGFSINANELVRFIQPSQLSAILNRVTGQDPSVILGAMQANGRVFLINPNGILFGRDATINVGSLFASTLNLTDTDFLQGRFRLDQTAGQAPAAIVNEGHLEMAPGGFLVLASPLVSNQGVILATTGQVALAAGSHMEVNFDGQGLINLALDTPSATPGTVAMNSGMVNNLVGSLLSLSSAEDITTLDASTQLAGAEGRLINYGTIRADGVAGQDAGRVVLNSTEGTYLMNGSVVSANGVGANSNGGTVLAVSENFAALAPSARLEAHSGDTGDGGFVEFSGHQNFQFEGQVDLNAPQGTPGAFLLDPTNLTIIAGPDGTGDQDVPTFNNGRNSTGLANQPLNTITNNFINSTPTGGTLILQADQNIVIDAPINPGEGTTTRFLASNGDITSTVNAGTVLGSTFNRNLEFVAGRNVTMTGSNSPAGGAYIANGGAITVVAGNVTQGDVTLNTTLSANFVTVDSRRGDILNPLFVGIVATDIVLDASGSIGTSVAPVLLGSADRVQANAAAGSVFLRGAATSPIVEVRGGSANTFSVVSPTSLGFQGQVFAPTVRLSAAQDIVHGSTVTNDLIRSNDIQLSSTNGQISSVTTVPFSGTNTLLSAQAASGVSITQNSGDMTIGAAGVNAGNGASLFAPSGSILANSASGRVTGQSVGLTANQVGTAADPVRTSGSSLGLTGSNVFIDHQGAASINRLAGTNANNSVVSISSNADVTIGNVFSPAQTFSLTTSGSILSGSPIPMGTSQITANTVNLTGQTGIGTDSSLHTNAPSLNLSAPNGRVSVTNDQATTVAAQAAAGVDLVNQGDITIGAAGVNGGTGGSRLFASNANILATAASGSVINADLAANNIGTTTNPVRTGGANVFVNSPGQVNLSQTGPTRLVVDEAFGANANSLVTVASDSTVTIGNNFATQGANGIAGLNITSSAGTIEQDQAFPFTVRATDINLQAPGGIGTVAPIRTAATNLSLVSSTGSISVSEADGANLSGQAGGDFTVNAGGGLTISRVQAGGNVNLDVQGAITGAGSGTNIQSAAATLTATDTVGTAGRPLITQVQSLQASGSSGVFVDQTGSLTASVTSTGGPIRLAVDEGTLTIGLLASATTLDVEVCGGSILDGNGDGLNIQSGGSTTLTASGVIGTQPDPIDVVVGSGSMRVAAGSQLNATSIAINGIVPNDRLEVFTPPPGTTCFSNTPPGAVIFNGQPTRTPASSRGLDAVQTPLINLFPPPFLDNRGRVMGSSFIPFYTLTLAFLLDEDEWLKFLNETVVWESDPEETSDL
ncbi:filamentous hemagglutinin N-terminal domain-containing protein [bacterium]|nr:filamentous hemagglutinin N-terminal domain-containing protein [bacterium]